ncbi:hypothetical protein DFS34DRAFT_701455 [Phlyctochytrium arcticum]|nr:hypothetical protein DFS34DRAFT_701455 [Phlyctochytrium arcticum]
MTRTSSAKGKSGTGKQPQKYQNVFAWKPDKRNTHALKISQTPSSGLCRKCLDIIEWRKRMNKYKPLTQPKTCLSCLQKRVAEAYHVLCRPCAEERGVCAKCQDSPDVVPSEVKTPAERLKESQEEQRVLASMSERQRRTYLRRMERGDEEGAQKVKEVAEAKEGDGDFSDFDDSEEEEEEEK